MKEKAEQVLKKEWHLPKAAIAEEAIKRFSLTERVLFYVLLVFFIAGGLTLLFKVNQAFLVEIPREGGTLTEGIVGSPRFINPLLAISDADRDLVALIYSGLLKATPEGELVPDLAERYEISPDGLSYTFVLRDDVTFHDGETVTTQDILFTIERAKDPALKSPKRANWEGVQVEVVNEKEIRFLLRQPYSPFVENLTLGILPKHIWKDADAEQFSFSQYNIEPIGSGPYKIDKIKRNASGVPMYYYLSPFKDYALGKPFIANLVIRFYSSSRLLMDGFRNGDIQNVNSLSPAEARTFTDDDVRIESSPLPRIFGIFFNQNQAPVLANKEVRVALNKALDKQKIVDSVLYGYGTVIDGPIPEELLGKATTTEALTTGIEEARAHLEKNGWTRNEETGIYEKKSGKETHVLAFALSTSNTPELKNAATLAGEMWKELGANVEVKIFETGDLNQNVIRARKYDALLFGEIIGRDLDLFAFWHSSQRNDPGLNIALYTNIKADRLLEEARTISNKEERLAKYRAFEKEVATDVPALFTYSPDFLYIVPKNLKGFTMRNITVPPERFLGVHKWYLETEKVWKIFVNEE